MVNQPGQGSIFGRIFLLITFGLVPAGAGIAAILASSQFPDLAGRIFGGIVGLFFLAFSMIGFRGAFARKSEWPASGPGNDDPSLARKSDYDCDNCGAGLDREAEVSPKGDVKCSYCGKWFNIYE